VASDGELNQMRKFSFSFLFIILVLSFFSGVIVQVQATVLFSDGQVGSDMEVYGDFRAWTSTNNNPRVLAENPHHGINAMAHSLSSAYWYATKTFAGQPTVYARLLLRPSILPSSNTDYFVFMRLVGDLTATLKIVYVTDHLELAVGGQYPFTDATPYTYAFQSGIYYSIEMKIVVHASLGELRVYLGGVEVITLTGINTSLMTEVTSLLVGETDTSGTNYQHKIDCVVVADAYIGPEGTAYTADLSQSVSSTWNLSPQASFKTVFSQSVTSSWTLTPQWNALLTLSQSATLTWNLLPRWVAYADFTQAITTTWNTILNWNAVADLSQSIAATWAILTRWNANVGLSFEASFTWAIDVFQSVAGGAAYTVDLTLSVLSSWLTSLQWNAVATLSQTLGSTWNLLSGWAANVNLELSIAASWLFDAWTGVQQTVDLTLSVVTSWAVDLLHSVGVNLTTADDALAVGLIFGLIAIALAIVMPVVFMRRRRDD